MCEGTVTLTPLVLTVTIIRANPGWSAEIRNQRGQLLNLFCGIREDSWLRLRNIAARWALTYVQDRGGRVILPDRLDTPERRAAR